MKKKDTDLIDRFVGMRIAYFRNFLGMSREKAASKIGVTGEQLRKYEIGKDRITVSRLVRISEAFGVPIENFFKMWLETMAQEELQAEKHMNRRGGYLLKELSPLSHLPFKKM